jgi:acetoin utilization protein AcuB
MRLQDIMTSEVEIIAPHATADEAWTLMQQAGIHHLVVVEEAMPVGVVSDRDLGGPRGAPLRRDRCVEDLMTRTLVTAEPEMTLRRAANLMRGRSIGCLPVVDSGKLRGIVTVSDLLEQLGRHPQAAGPSVRYTTRLRRPQDRAATARARS